MAIGNYIQESLTDGEDLVHLGRFHWMYHLQAVLNIAVVTNTIPNTGISLPFFSSGGTSLMMLLGEMGIVLSVSRGET